MSISAADFTFVTQMIKQRSSIDLKAGKEYLVESRLTPLARQRGEDLNALIGALRRGDESLRESVVDALTTNETSFFRDHKPFQAFSKHVLPEVAKQARNKQLNLWSAACSSGQEAYSLAIMLHEWSLTNPGWTIRILGTDISETMVNRSRAGTYSQIEVGRGMPAAQLVKYFVQNGREWTIKPHLREMCRFERANLAALPPSGLQHDVVFLRNVLIYFDMDTKHRVLGHVRKVLRPGGFLVLGGAESTISMDGAFQRMELEQATVFRLAGGMT